MDVITERPLLTCRTSLTCAFCKCFTFTSTVVCCNLSSKDCGDLLNASLMWNEETALPLHHMLFSCSFLRVLLKQPAVRKLWGRWGHNCILYLSAPPPCLPRYAQYAGVPRATADSSSQDLRNQMSLSFSSVTQAPDCYPHFEKAFVTSGNLRNHRGDLEVYSSR